MGEGVDVLAQRTKPSLRRGRRLRFTLVCALAATVSASVTVAVAGAPSPAAAYYQAYNCQSFIGQPTCHLTAGSWHSITAVGASNYDVAGDICAQFSAITSSARCATTGYSIVICTASWYQYGVSFTYYGDNDNISGHEDDSNNCT